MKHRHDEFIMASTVAVARLFAAGFRLAIVVAGRRLASARGRHRRAPKTGRCGAARRCATWSRPEKDPPDRLGRARPARTSSGAQPLGSKSYGNPVIADGLVYVGTNNEGKRDPDITADGGVLMAFDEKTGKFLWQRVQRQAPHRPRQRLARRRALLDRLHRGQPRLVLHQPLRGRLPRRQPGRQDAQRGLDLRHDRPARRLPAQHDRLRDRRLRRSASTSSPATASTTRTSTSSPPPPRRSSASTRTPAKSSGPTTAPGANVLHGQWASAAIARSTAAPLVIAPLGDAWVYAFDAKTGKIVWKFDTNPKDADLSADAQRDHRHAVHRRQPDVHRQRPGPRARRRLRPHVVRGHHQDRRHQRRTGRQSRCSPSPSRAKNWSRRPARSRSRKGKPNPNSAVVWHFDQVDLNGDGNDRPRRAHEPHDLHLRA